MIGAIKRVDWALNGAIFFIAAAGGAMLLSSAPDLFIRQILFFSVGMILLLGISIIDIRPIVNYRWLILTILLISIFLLILVHFIGIEVNNSKSWLDFYWFRIQPSEFSKSALIIVLAAFWSRRHIGIKRMGVIFGSFAYFVFPAALILMEPDLGSVLILFGIWFGFLLVAGLPAKYIAASMVIFALLGALGWNFGLQDYQKNRIMAVFRPGTDPLGVDFNVIQSKNAIGSAGLFGKGFGQGAIVQLGFLPVAQTDFAFASFTEEWGLISGGIVILVFAFIIWRITVIGIKASDNFSKFICLGTIIFLGLQFAVNIGSVIGLTPVIGVVFPFLSAGGSNLLSSMLLLGIVQNIAARKAV